MGPYMGIRAHMGPYNKGPYGPIWYPTRTGNPDCGSAPELPELLVLGDAVPAALASLLAVAALL